MAEKCLPRNREHLAVSENSVLRGTRRPHGKSRLGCFRCKQRRVKCNEVRPVCASCQRLGLACEYPLQESTPRNQPSTPLNSLALQDLRFYHQFLTVGYPSVPLRARETWEQVAAMSHQYDFLAEALLGLGASHLTQHSSGLDHTLLALQHRSRAIRRVNEEIARRDQQHQHAEALLAATVCLSAQSALMMTPETPGDSLSSDLTCEGLARKIRSLAADQPVIDYELVEGFESALTDLRPILSSDAERRYLDGLLDSIDILGSSASKGNPHSSNPRLLLKLPAWTTYVDVWLMPTLFDNGDFNNFVSRENRPGQILIIHGFLVEYLLGHCCVPLEFAPQYGRRKDTVIYWATSVASDLTEDLKSYMSWALEYCERLKDLDARTLMSP